MSQIIGFTGESCNLFASDLDMEVTHGGKNLFFYINRRELNFSKPSKLIVYFFNFF